MTELRQTPESPQMPAHEVARNAAIKQIRDRKALGDFPSLIVFGLVLSAIATPMIIYGLASPPVTTFRTGTTGFSAWAGWGLFVAFLGQLFFFMGLHELLVILRNHFAIHRISVDERGTVYKD